MISSGKAFPGSLEAGKDYIDITCSEGYLRIHKLQMEGKKAMKADEFLRGMRHLDNYKVI